MLRALQTREHAVLLSLLYLKSLLGEESFTVFDEEDPHW